MDSATNVHATGILLGQHGVLIRGATGTGKSLLALELLNFAEQTGTRARLIADDRLNLHRKGANLLMSTPEQISGLIELRGRGVIERDFVRQAPVDLVIDLVDKLERFPEPSEFRTEIDGIRLPRCPVPRRGEVDPGHQLLLIREALRALAAEKAGARQKTA
jgi:serine kinase of HPr protein (carbohydrate metabolism regulator)